MIEEWRLAALCKETDPDAFFPEKGQSPRPALRICGRCEPWVRDACLADALELEGQLAGAPVGVRGGKTAKERKALLGKRKPSGGKSATGGGAA